MATRYCYSGVASDQCMCVPADARQAGRHGGVYRPRVSPLSQAASHETKKRYYLMRRPVGLGAPWYCRRALCKCRMIECRHRNMSVSRGGNVKRAFSLLHEFCVLFKNERHISDVYTGHHSTSVLS